MNNRMRLLIKISVGAVIIGLGVWWYNWNDRGLKTLKGCELVLRHPAATGGRSSNPKIVEWCTGVLAGKMFPLKTFNADEESTWLAAMDEDMDAHPIESWPTPKQDAGAR